MIPVWLFQHTKHIRAKQKRHFYSTLFLQKKIEVDFQTKSNREKFLSRFFNFKNDEDMSPNVYNAHQVSLQLI